VLDDLGLADRADRPARTLSGGMRRRLNLALALVHDPEIVVLDEPEAGLDPQSRVMVREYIQSLAHNKTVILTTHNMDEADRVADRVAIIDHGELLRLDTPEALKHSVGQGDVLEIAVRGDEGVAGKVQAAIGHLSGQLLVSMADGTLAVRAPNVVALLPTILEALAAADVPCGEVHLRENTLEDVFIQLTGRRLRE
jgi:ABC-2 type transport system ATP-binding protein